MYACTELRLDRTVHQCRHDAECKVEGLHTQLHDLTVDRDAAECKLALLQEEVLEKDCTISRLRTELTDTKQVLNASMCDATRRGYLIQSILAAPPHVLDVMNAALLPELPASRKCARASEDEGAAARPSTALSRAGTRSRSPKPRTRRDPTTR